MKKLKVWFKDHPFISYLIELLVELPLYWFCSFFGAALACALFKTGYFGF